MLDNAKQYLNSHRCVQVEPNTGRTMIDVQDEVYRENIGEREAKITALNKKIADLEATVEAQQQMLQDGVEKLLGNREEIYTLKMIQDQISFDKQIEGWGQEKRDRMERFVAEAEHMTDAELDAAMYDFGDAEGTFCQRYARGRAAMRRMIDLHTRQPVPTVDPAEEQKMVERIRQSGVKVSFDVE